MEYHWIKIDDRLPDVDTPVWLWGPDDGIWDDGIWIGARAEGGIWGKIYGSLYHDDDGWKFFDLEVYDYHPTHWMPLPNIPALQPA